MKFNGKKFPKNADELLNKAAKPKNMSPGEWKTLIGAMEMNYGPAVPSKYKSRPKRKV